MISVLALRKRRTHCKKCSHGTLEYQVARGVLNSLSILIAAAKDPVDESLRSIELISENLLILSTGGAGTHSSANIIYAICENYENVNYTCNLCTAS